MDITPLTALIVVTCGVLVGILSAMFGVGGGTIMVPLIHLAFGQPAAVASGTSLFAIFPTSLISMCNRLHDGTIRFKVGLAIGLSGAFFSPLGAYAASTLPGHYAMLLTSCFIFYTAYNMFRRAARMSAQTPASEQPYAPAQPAPPSAAGALKPAPLANATGPRLYLAAAGLGVVVGFLSGYVGLGGGFLIVPLLQWALGFTMKQATGTSLVAVAILAVPSCTTHALLGNVAWAIGLLLIAGSFVGSRIGTAIGKRTGDRTLTALFGTTLAISGLILAVTELLA